MAPCFSNKPTAIVEGTTAADSMNGFRHSFHDYIYQGHKHRQAGNHTPCHPVLKLRNLARMKNVVVL